MYSVKKPKAQVHQWHINKSAKMDCSRMPIEMESAMAINPDETEYSAQRQ